MKPANVIHLVLPKRVFLLFRRVLNFKLVFQRGTVPMLLEAYKFATVICTAP